MPGEIIGELFLQIVCFFVAKFLLPILTFGRVHVDSTRKRPIRFRWHGMHRLPTGRVIVNPDLAGLIGLLMLLAFGGIGLLVYFSFWH